MRPDRPSATAILIARSILVSARDAQLARLVAPDEPEIIGRWLAEAAPARWFEGVVRRSWSRHLVLAAERRILSGMFAHYLARKRWLEKTVQAALAGGVTQVIVLGAGLDAMCWRLHREHASVWFFELDHPATQAAKARITGGDVNLTLLPMDLATNSLAAALRNSPAFSSERPTVVVAEGLLMYLEEDRVAAILGELSAVLGRSLELLLTFMEPSTDGSIGFRNEHFAVRWWLRWRRERFRWGIARANMPDFLRTHGLGLRCLRVIDDVVLREEILVSRGLVDLPLARGECICHASRIGA